MPGKKEVLIDVAKMAARIGISLIPAAGAGAKVFDIVRAGLADTSDPANEKVLKALGEINDAQTQVLTEHERRLRAIEKRLAGVSGEGLAGTPVEKVKG